jgi:hydrogenase maturation protease
MSPGQAVRDSEVEVVPAESSGRPQRALLVVGLGSPHGDDRLGWAVVDHLRSRLPAGVSACKVRGGLDLLERLGGLDQVVVVDASVPAGRPGTIRAFEWPCRALAEGGSLSTHGMGLVAALQMAEALGRLPRRVRIIAVEAQDTSPAAGLSAAVARQIDAVATVVLEAARRFDGRVDREEGSCTR